MNKRERLGRGLFLTRDSGGKHETTPAEYLQWAIRKAAAIGVRLQATPDKIEQMIRENRSIDGDIFIDYGISGEKLSRKGLDAFVSAALTDLTVSHVFIPRRDRLARPEDPLDGVRLEDSLRQAGVTVVFMDRTCLPIVRGVKRDIGDMIASVIDYSTSGDFVIDLAQKMIHAQIHLAKQGFSVGGRAPYGFRRWLVKVDGTVVRQLLDGEYVKMAQHHVVWLPGPEQELATIQRIVEMLEKMPANRVAATLTVEGVPTPDSNRERTDRGVRHKTSGVWQQATINNIARNPLLGGTTVYGRRSMGRLLRYTPEGPRPLNDSEHLDEHRKKVVRNPDADHIVARASFEPLIESDRQKALIEVLNVRAGTQRGKPRSRQPAKNPLGGRVFDMACSWPMYRIPTGKGFCYKCALYQQSHGAKCKHNWVDGTIATKFVLNSLRQRMFSPAILSRLEKRLRQIAAQEHRSQKGDSDFRSKEAALKQVMQKLDHVSRNLALAESPEERAAVKKVFVELYQQSTRLELEVMQLKTRDDDTTDLNTEITLAMGTLDRLAGSANEQNLSAIGELFKKMNVNLFLSFKAVPHGKRPLNKLAGGVLTFGSAPLPMKPYQGPTARDRIGEISIHCAADGSTGSSPTQHNGEVEMLGNVNRGDSICTMLNESFWWLRATVPLLRIRTA